LSRKLCICTCVSIMNDVNFLLFINCSCNNLCHNPLILWPVADFFPIAKETHITYWDSDMIGYRWSRKLRTSPIFSRTEAKGKFGQSMGYERPLYFENEAILDDDDSNYTMIERSYDPSMCMQLLLLNVSCFFMSRLVRY
jgi:hypothetical protein